MKHVRITLCILATLGMGGATGATPVGRLLFAQTGTQIVGETGIARPARRGDVLQAGERLLTPHGGISQVLLPDGSLIGLRPDGELRFEQAPAGADTNATRVSLLGGAARLISSELMDPQKRSNFSFQSGMASLQLKGADLESALVKADEKSAPADGAPGSYQRLLVGAASVANGNHVAELSPRQVSFVGGVNAAPTTVSGAFQHLFANNRGATPTSTGGAAPEKGPAATALPKLGNLATGVRPIAPPPLPVPAPITRPCTRFIGKTCIQ